MRIIIDDNSTIPNYKQIIIQIKKAIIKNELKPNDQLPSIRTLAKDLNVAIITIKRAYEELEKDGITYTLGGKGVYIKDLDANKLKLELLNDIAKDLHQIIKLALYYGIDNTELLNSFKEELENESNRN